MFEERIIGKVPGNPCQNPKEKQGFLEDLQSKTKVELCELLERQNKLLANKSFVAKLSDKGERIRAFKKRIQEALTQCSSRQETCNLLSDLSISEKGAPQNIEWTGKLTETLSDSEASDAELEETDPLKILATHGGAGTYKKIKNRLLKEQENLGHSSKQKSIFSKKDSETSKAIEVGDVYANNLCKKIDKPLARRKEPFRPHCTTKSGMHPGLYTPLHQSPHWEVTAATPPPPVHGATKLVSLQESLALQEEQAVKLKEVQTKHAAEKLAANFPSKIGTVLPDASKRSMYREPQQFCDSSDSSDNEKLCEQFEDEDDEKHDTIVYTYTE